MRVSSGFPKAALEDEELLQGPSEEAIFRYHILMLEDAYNNTGDALYVWNALKLILDAGEVVPPWIGGYLYESSERLFEHVEEAKNGKEIPKSPTANDKVAEALRLKTTGGGASIFTRFANYEHRAAAFVQFSKRPKGVSLEYFAPKVTEWFKENRGVDIPERTILGWCDEFKKKYS